MSNSSRSKLHIEAVQTVMPSKPTDPRKFLKLKLDPQNLTNFQRRFNVVLCYNKVRDEESGWLVAGWIKESLGKAFEEEPLLAGRLRRDEETGQEFEIVSNDSGVRLVEAKIDMRLDEFLAMKSKAETEAELVFWEDVVEKTPQFSPMLYVQVTNFSCGGYSIGITCSLLLADPFALTSFLKRWAKIHYTLLSKNDVSQIPTFYLPNLGRPSTGFSPALLMASNTCKTCAAQSVIFEISDNQNSSHKDLVSLCIDEAEKTIGAKMASKFSLLIKEASEDVKVEVCSKLFGQEAAGKVNGSSKNARIITWDELGLEKICFSTEENKPAYVSCWINSLPDEGSVIFIPSNDEEIKIVVTFTQVEFMSLVETDM